MFVTYIIVAICGVICLACMIIITIMKVKEKGIFKKDDNEIDVTEITDDPFSKYDEVKTEKSYHQPKEDLYTEEDFDFTPYLIEKGYKTDYSQMSEAEKNDVMILLMTLRYEKKITEDECKKEEIKLWKK